MLCGIDYYKRNWGSCQIYGSTVQLVGGVVTSHLVDLELIHAAEACTPSRPPHALILQRLALQKSAVTAICSALFFCRENLCRVKACGRLVCKLLQCE